MNLTDVPEAVGGQRRVRKELDAGDVQRAPWITDEERAPFIHVLEHRMRRHHGKEKSKLVTRNLSVSGESCSGLPPAADRLPAIPLALSECHWIWAVECVLGRLSGETDSSLFASCAPVPRPASIFPGWPTDSRNSIQSKCCVQF